MNAINRRALPLAAAVMLVLGFAAYAAEPDTVTSADAGATFKSAALDTDDKFSFTFDKPGTYKYFCSVHPHMSGTIIVK